MDGNPISYLELLLLLSMLLWMSLRLWPKTVVASSRQHLFELRDRLFNLALEGRIAFSDPLYRDLRERLNLALRFTHKLTFVTFLVAIKSCPESPSDTLAGNIEQLDNVGLRKELQTIYNRTGFVLLEHIFKRSPFAFALMVIYLFFSVSIPFSERLKRNKTRLLTILSSKTAENDLAHAA